MKPQGRPCGLIEADCVCALDVGHEGYHECRRDNCGGRWIREGTTFRIVRIPGDTDGSQTEALKEFLLGGGTAEMFG